MKFKALRLAAAFLCAGLSVAHADPKPVSYTHLDVYKRQIVQIMEQ